MLLGTGMGLSAGDTSVPGDTTTLPLADFNGDGNGDLALAGSVAVRRSFLGNGDGTFQSAIGYATQGAAGYRRDGRSESRSRARLLWVEVRLRFCLEMATALLVPLFFMELASGSPGLVTLITIEI